MAAFNKFNAFVEHLAEKVHNLQGDSLKILLTNLAPQASQATRSQLTEVAPGAGYAAGGQAAVVLGSGESAGIYKLTLADVVFTAAGGSIGPFRYAVLYNDTPTSPADPLIGWYDYGSSITLADGETFTVDFDAVNGALTLA
ncbi:MAG: hypothetical protein ACK41C_12795 [Phenylobacterium sp.]|uniref:hypothetical protein n=1 Tax=Phenylobacterium sp. TaxID=1871053 RepID=UPI00391B5246